MSYRYIALTNHDDSWNKSESLAVQEAVLGEMGLEKCCSSGLTSVFVSKETPSLLIPECGVIIGHIFSRDGQAVVDGRILAQATSEGALEKHLLDNYWGEYVLLYFSEKKEQGLKILRDPSGGVPCVYSLQAGAGFITSNLSIAIHLNLYSKQIDWDYIAQALAFTYLQTPRTGLSDISELLPGCMLSLRGSRVTIQTSWSPWDFIVAPNRHSDIGDAAAEIRRAVSTVVKSWAEVDGEILLKLSGGLDSSIVAACLRGSGARVVCFTQVMPPPGTNEQQYARQMADYLGAAHHVQSFTYEHDCINFPLSLDDVVPAVNIMQRSGEKSMEIVGNTYDVTSFFSGDGGDTIFCYFRNASPAADAFKERGLAAGLAAIKNISTVHQCTIWKAGRLALKKLMRGPSLAWKTDHLFLNPLKVTSTLPPHPWFDVVRDALPGDREKIHKLIGTRSYSRTSRSEGGGRAERQPLLSQPVMEACLKVPSWMWVSGGQNRFVARAAFADLLPEGVRNRRDKGSYLSQHATIYRKNKSQMRDFLLAGHLQAQKFLDEDGLAKFFERDLSSSNSELFSRIFDLCMIENWLRQQV